MSAEFNQPEFNQDEFNQSGGSGGGGGGFVPGDLTVFPSLGALGYTASHQFRETMRIYDDGSYRRRLRPVFDHRVINLTFDGIQETEKNSIVTFFNARKSSSTANGDKFFFYSPEETSSIDPTAGEETGRHVAIFMDDSCEFDREGPISWSGSLKFFVLS